MLSPFSMFSSLGLPGARSLFDTFQIALAAADEAVLRSLLTDSVPAIMRSPRIGSVTAEIGVPLGPDSRIDGVLHFENKQCVLAQNNPDRALPWTTEREVVWQYEDYSRLTRCQSELHTLLEGASLAQAIALLSRAGFSPDQVDAILRLPQAAWHKSWWYSLDSQGFFAVPFQRLIRTRCYTDGTFTLQYRDYYPQDQPPCFMAQAQQVVVKIWSPQDGFSETLAMVNRARKHLETTAGLLICDTHSDPDGNRLSGLEAQGYMNQGISLYAAAHMMVPVRADCHHCGDGGCPLQGNSDSPVLQCDRFYWADVDSPELPACRLLP